jgi:hypothetical protein
MDFGRGVKAVAPQLHAGEVGACVAGLRLRADLPIARLLWWSIPTTLSLEPYMAIKLAPGEEKRWTHTLDYYGPGDN